jgi:hypothetical protein
MSLRDTRTRWQIMELQFTASDGKYMPKQGPINGTTLKKPNAARIRSGTIRSHLNAVHPLETHFTKISF